MGHRLSRIVTRTGDEGSTGLANGERLPKTHARIAALGEADELNCHLGVLLAQPGIQPWSESLRSLQHRLFDLGAELSLPGAQLLKSEALEQLEQWIERLNAQLPPLKEFILPGGGPAAAQAQLARAVARRLERALWAVHAGQALPATTLAFGNRLSDYLFVLARCLVREAAAAGGSAEQMWQRDAP